jgi:hypothetical protein
MDTNRANGFSWRLIAPQAAFLASSGNVPCLGPRCRITCLQLGWRIVSSVFKHLGTFETHHEMWFILYILTFFSGVFPVRLQDTILYVGRTWFIWMYYNIYIYNIIYSCISYNVVGSLYSRVVLISPTGIDHLRETMPCWCTWWGCPYNEGLLTVRAGLHFQIFQFSWLG